jgi:hypothetical protein
LPLVRALELVLALTLAVPSTDVAAALAELDELAEVGVVLVSVVIATALDIFDVADADAFARADE